MSLLNNKNLSIQITDTAINILIGNKNKIYETHTIDLKNGICRDGNVRDKDYIIKVLNDYLDINARNIKNVSFVLRGSDLITRYIEVPILKGDALRDAVDFEFEQFIPDINKYYTNFEIVKKINNKEKKAYKILLAAAPKEKINPIVEIAEAINKELEAIDILSNSLARVLKISNHITTEESTGVFYFGADSSTVSIIEDNILKFERNLPFGVKNIFNELYKEGSGNNLNSEEFANTFDNNPELMVSFQNLLASVNNTIRYYNSEKSNQPVSNFVIICEDMVMKNMKKNLEQYLELPCILINDPIDLGIKVKFEDNFPKYMASYGLLLRGNNHKLLNLNPKAIDRAKNKDNIDKALVIFPIITLLAIISIATPFLVMNKMISKNILTIEENIAKYSEIIDKNKELKSENDEMEYFINRVNGIKSNTTKTSEVLSKLNSYVPKEINFINLSFSDNGSIDIVGESDTYDAISEFLANLEMSEEFYNAKIGYINPIEKFLELSRLNNISNKTFLAPASIRSVSGKYDIVLASGYNIETVVDDSSNMNNDHGNMSDYSSNVNDDYTNAENGSTTTNNIENGTNNSGTGSLSNDDSISNSDSIQKSYKSVIKYSFSISIEGVNTDGSKAKEAE